VVSQLSVTSLHCWINFLSYTFALYTYFTHNIPLTDSTDRGFSKEANSSSVCQWFPEFYETKNLLLQKNKKPTRCHLLHLLYFLDTQHVSGINMSIFRSLRLCCWPTTLAVQFLDCCMLESGCGSVRVVSGLPAEAQPQYLTPTHSNPRKIRPMW